MGLTQEGSEWVDAMFYGLNNSKNNIQRSFEKVNKSGSKGLEALLSSFHSLSDTESKSILRLFDQGGYFEEIVPGHEALINAGNRGIIVNFLTEGLEKLDYTLKDVESFVQSEEVYKDDSTKFLGIFTSAAIRAVAKPGDTVRIKSLKPIDYLFTWVKKINAYVDVAGDNLAEFAYGSKIHANVAGYYAGHGIKKSKLYIQNAGDGLALSARDSEINFDKAGEYAINNAHNCIIKGKTAGKYLGDNMENSKLYIEKINGNLGQVYNNGDILLHNKIYKNGLPYLPFLVKKGLINSFYSCKSFLKEDLPTILRLNNDEVFPI